MAKVAIVILNWNGQKMLAKYLPNVVEYSRQDAEIWVADNNSSDQSMLLLETQFPHVKYIRLLRKDLVLERFVSQSPKELLVAPKWGLKNYEFTNLLNNKLKSLL